MSRHIDRILDLLDDPYQSSRESGCANDPCPTLCARCRRMEKVEDGDLCAQCRAFLLGDTDEDVRRNPPLGFYFDYLTRQTAVSMPPLVDDPDVEEYRLHEEMRRQQQFMVTNWVGFPEGRHHVLIEGERYEVDVHRTPWTYTRLH